MSEATLSALISTLFGVSVGGIISFLVARKYAREASKELIKETDLLRQQNALVLQAMEAADMVNLNRDVSGRIIGIRFDSPYRTAAQSDGAIMLLGTDDLPTGKGKQR